MTPIAQDATNTTWRQRRHWAHVFKFIYRAANSYKQTQIKHRPPVFGEECMDLEP